MKGKRYTAEEKIRMLCQADKGKTILEVCRDNNISKQSFHRWKREFGMIDVNEAKRMKELFEGERGAKTDARRQAAGDRDCAGDPRIKWKMSLTLGSKRWAQGSMPLGACAQGLQFFFKRLLQDLYLSSLSACRSIRIFSSAVYLFPFIV